MIGDGWQSAVRLICREVARTPWIALSALRDLPDVGSATATPKAPVLVLGGFLSHPAYYAPLGRMIARRGHAVHFDGAVNVQALRPHLAALGEQVAELADRAGASVRLVGHSLGGLQAMALLAERPDVVGDVVAVASPVAGGTPWRPLQRLAERVLGVGAADATTLREALAPHVGRITTVSVPGDLVAPPERCALSGARNVVLSTLPRPDRVLETHTGVIFMRSVLHVILAALERPVVGLTPASANFAR